MAVVTPPGFLQNAGAVHTAEILRASYQGLIAGTLTSGSLRTRGGVHPSIGANLKVQQAGSPNMTVDVLSGQCYVPGTESSKQANYSVVNDATLNVAIAAADPSNPRIDLIVVRIQDAFYSGVPNTVTIERVAGTPAASPSIPAAPNNSLILAQIAVGAGVSSIVNANITDRRFYVAAAGGVISCTSTTRPTTTTITDGQLIYEGDTQLMYVWNATAAAFRLVYPYKAQTLLGGTTASITFSAIPTTIRNLRLEWTARSTDAGFVAHGISIRINGDSTANYFTQLVQGANTAASASLAASATAANVGLMLNSTATAGRFAKGNIDIYGWNSPHTNSLGWTFDSFLFSDSATSAWFNAGGGLYMPAGPYTSLTIFPAVGSFAAGTEVQIMGWD